MTAPTAAADAPAAPPSPGPTRRIARGFSRHRGLGLGGTLGPPLAWLLVVYVGSIAILVVTAFFTLDTRSFQVTGTPTLENVHEAFTVPEYRTVVLRSLGVATAVTIIDLLIALPMAFYIAKIAAPWARRALITAALLPLWAGYLVKGYALKAVFQPGSEFGIDTSGGVLASTIGWTPGTGVLAVTLGLAYLWLPYMVLPIYAGLERLPTSLLDASGDLGARPGRTIRSVVLPMLVPSIAAGSIFTFSLALGDYIIPVVLGGKTQLIGNLIARTMLAPNQPLAAAFTLWPIFIMIAYLVVMNRLGAFENL
ncbi:MAG: ABC transporter permease [Acidimicrobiales bacterium]|nr:ABC transporter permease [Acidimicrobiales bacterium]